MGVGWDAGAVTVLIDDARVPYRDRLWCHLASDASLEELHAFARAVGIPEGGFDADHYDVPADQRADLVDAGALPVTSQELVAALNRSGLRRRRTRSSKHPPAR